MSRRMSDLLMAIVFAAVIVGLSHTAQSGPASRPAASATAAGDQARSAAKGDLSDDLLPAVKEMRKEMRELRHEVESLSELLGSGKEGQLVRAAMQRERRLEELIRAERLPMQNPGKMTRAEMEALRAEAVPAARPDTARFEARCYPVADLLTYAQGATDANIKDKFEKLITLITDVIEPKTWKSAGGKGSIQSHEATLSLVVQQSPSTHKRILSLLRNLRMLQSWQISLEVAIVDNPMPDLLKIVNKLTGVDGSDVLFRLTDDQRTGLLDAARCGLATKVSECKAMLDFGGLALIRFHSGSDIDLVQPAIVIESANSTDRYGANLRFSGCDLSTGKLTHNSVAANLPSKKGALIVLRKRQIGDEKKASANQKLLIVRPRVFLPEEEEEHLEAR
jgi:hypothetical protein